MELELTGSIKTILLSWQTGLALFCLAAYCFNKFNNWTLREKSFGKDNPPRQYTTKSRYFTYAFLYTLTMAAGYLMLLCFPNLLGLLQQQYNIEALTQLVDKAAQNKDYPLVLLIVLIGVLPTIKPLAQAENRLRSWFHRQAFIPTQAMALVIQLQTTPYSFHPDEHEQSVILEDLADYLPKDAAPTEPSHSIWHKWFKLLYLRHKITLWQQTPEISQFNLDFGKAYHEGNDLFTSLKSELKYYARREKQHDQRDSSKNEKEQEFLEQERNSLDRLKNKLIQEIDHLLETTYQYICCGILSTKGSQTARNDQFEFFDLRPKVEDQMPFVVDSILSAMFFVFVVTSLTTVVDKYITNASIELLKAFSIGLLHTFMQGGCIFLAMFLFNRYRKAGWLQNISEQEKHSTIIIGPMFRGLIGAVVGYCAALPIFAFWLYSIFNMHTRYSFLEVIWTFWYWPIPVAVTTYFITCYLVKIRMEFRMSKRESAIPQRNTRILDKCRQDTWCEGLIQAIVQGFSAFMVCQLHAGLHPERANIGQLTFYIVTTLTLTGWCIGRIFPKEYHHILAIRRKEQLGEIPTYFATDEIRRLKNRRKGKRYQINQPVSVLADQEYKLDRSNISISGAVLPLELEREVGTNLRLKIPEIGDFLGTIIRKVQGFTYLHFILTEMDRTKLACFLAEQEQAIQLS